MSDQGWNTPGTPPPDPNTGASWNQPNPPPAPQQPWGQQAPPPPGGEQWSQQPPPPQGQEWGQQPPAPQQWGQQPPQGQWGPGPGQPQAGGIDPKIAGILAYLFGWVGGLVVYLVNKDNFSRFHGAQSILLSIAGAVVWVGLFVVGLVLGFVADFFGPVFFLLFWLLFLAFIALAIYLMISAYQGKKVVLPVIGPMAEQWAAKPA